jgi:hypothetical protein
MVSGESEGPVAAFARTTIFPHKGGHHHDVMYMSHGSRHSIEIHVSSALAGPWGPATSLLDSQRRVTFHREAAEASDRTEADGTRADGERKEQLQ